MAGEFTMEIYDDVILNPALTRCGILFEIDS